MTIFDWINQMLVTKKHWDEFTEDEQKKFSPFIINRWLSMDKDFIEFVNVFQKYAIGTLEPREVYKWYCDILPKGKRFNKYIKGKKDKKDVQNSDKSVIIDNIFTSNLRVSDIGYASLRCIIYLLWSNALKRQRS